VSSLPSGGASSSLVQFITAISWYLNNMIILLTTVIAALDGAAEGMPSTPLGGKRETNVKGTYPVAQFWSPSFCHGY
jgi:hypothetical protein